MNALDLFEQLRTAGRLTPDEEKTYLRLRGLEVDRVDLVPRGANKRRFAVVKEGSNMGINDYGIGPAVVDTGDGGFVMTDDPQDIAKADALKDLKAAQSRLNALITKMEGDESFEFGTEAKAIGDLLSVASGAPVPANPGTQEKQNMSKDDKDTKPAVEPAAVDPNAVDLDGTTIDHEALVPVAKAGRRMNGATLTKFKEHMSGLQDILRTAEQNPGDAMAAAISEAMAPVAKAFTQGAEKQAELVNGFMALVKKHLGQEDAPAGDAAADDKAPVTKADEPAKPAPVQGGQAKPAATQVAKADDDLGWGDVCGIDFDEAE